MTASDPAVAAAFRVAEDWGGPYDIGAGVEAAREALAPLRRRHYPVAYIDRQRCCVTCFDWQGKPKVWPCDTARLVYPEGEL